MEESKKNLNRFAVIASNCFTGCHIVDALLNDPKAEVIGISRSPEYKDIFLPYKVRQNARFKFYQMDLNHNQEPLIRLLDEFKPAYVINVAALSEVGLSNYSPIEYYETNTLAVVKLCHALREKKYLERYIHISSAEVYGSCPFPLEETAPLNPSTPYAVSKAAADMHLLTLGKNFGFPVNLVRSTNVYGRHQQLFKIIPRVIIYVKTNKVIELHGGGAAVKTWVHVRDVAQGVLDIIRAGKPGEIYHFTDKHSVSVKELVKNICEKMKVDYGKVTHEVGERLGQDSKYVLNDQKARRELGWKPVCDFDESIQEVIDWIERDWDQIIKQPLTYVHKVS